MNIYKVVDEEREDYICAPNIKEATEFYSNEVCTDFVLKKLTKKELNWMYLTDLNEGEPDWDEYVGDLQEEDFGGGYLITETFAEYLKTAKYTEIISTNNY